MNHRILEGGGICGLRVSVAIKLNHGSYNSLDKISVLQLVINLVASFQQALIFSDMVTGQRKQGGVSSECSSG